MLSKNIRIILKRNDNEWFLIDKRSNKEVYKNWDDLDKVIFKVKIDGSEYFLHTKKDNCILVSENNLSEYAEYLI